MKNKMNLENPLTKYRLSHLNQDWKELSKITGLTIQTLFDIANGDREKVLSVSLKTYKKLKESIEVDLLDW